MELAKSATTDLFTTIISMLKVLMTKEVARCYTYTGRSGAGAAGKKKKFCSSRAHKAIIGMCK